MSALASGGAALMWSRRRAERAERAELLREQGRLEERERIAREVHDTVTQGLSAIALLTRAAQDALAEGGAGPAVARERVAAAQEVAQQSLGQAHDLTAGVAYSQLRTGGLAPALEQLVALTRRTLAAAHQLAPAGPAPELALEITGPARRLTLLAESAALRLVQESLGNALRHSGAGQVVIELRHLPDRARIAVRDDGAGLPGGVPGPGPGLGLAGVERRVGLLGGRWSLETAAGVGTSVVAEFPYPKPTRTAEH